MKVDEMPTLSCSGFEYNNFLIIKNNMETKKEKKKKRI